MPQIDIITPVEPTEAVPVVRRLEIADLKAALAMGAADFWAMPTHVVFLCLIYPVAGLLIGRAVFGYELIPLLYPIAAGFTLLGPFAAIGLYELSRRREAALDTSWRHAFDVIHSPSFPSILALGGILLLLFVLWVGVAHAIYIANFGVREPESLATFLGQVLTTREGLSLIVAGNLAGLSFAIIAASLSVIAFPLLLDRNVGLATAMMTSLMVVARNPRVMAVWGLIVAAALLVGTLPLFFGLAIVVPVLGHATWHLYRRAIAPDEGPRPEYRPRPKGVRYAAEFPSSLFFPSRDEERK